ncbi:translation initiation factor [Balneola vulgaris]|jgi:translation initiation factor 1|uniref:translation initiation factor n=1 Tax=Balneola vulgaris TaxID=287535 RepID=UPI00037340F1|nr:translation initiation factor [Balneola vulgaris]
MKLSISVEKSGRRGKQVTVIRNIQHNPQHIEKIAKMLKSKLGTGGTVKGKVIEIQGSHIPKIKEILEKEGFSF